MDGVGRGMTNIALEAIASSSGKNDSRGRLKVGGKMCNRRAVKSPLHREFVSSFYYDTGVTGNVTHWTLASTSVRSGVLMALQ